jgi:hypothetical protein
VVPDLGIDTVGNQNNPYLPRSGAQAQVVFGIAPGIATASFENLYLNPSSTVVGIPGYSSDLINFVEQYDADQLARSGQSGMVQLTAAEAWTQFQQLPIAQQQTLVFEVFFKLLNQVGLDYNNASSPYYGQYARGYSAINTLFPADYGYTSNDLTGGVNGAKSLVSTGNLDIRGTTIQTQQGGSISILGPGGEVLVGSQSAPPTITEPDGTVVVGPNQQGILTLEQGNINLFSDASVLLAQSRIFTEQGGDVLIWSSNGDINAGKGAKTVSEIPPPEYFCDQDHYCYVDAKGQVSGAGIAALETKPGVEPGSVNLIAPRGTVDAGEAGIRVSGNLNIAALHVVNANNIDVQGKSTGIPNSAVSSSALAAANSATAAVDQAATDLARNQAAAAATVVTVEVIGFGSPDEEQKKKLRESRSTHDSTLR